MLDATSESAIKTYSKAILFSVTILVLAVRGLFAGDFLQTSDTIKSPAYNESDLHHSGSNNSESKIAEQSKLTETEQPELAKVRKVDELNAALSDIQSELKEVEPDSIKPTDDFKTILRAQKKLYRVSNRLDELSATVKKSCIVQDEKDLLVNEIEEQRKQTNLKLNELEKVQNAHLKHSMLSDLQTELEQIKLGDIKPTDDVQTINNAVNKLSEVSDKLNRLKRSVEYSYIVQEEKDSLTNEILEQINLVESKKTELAKVRNISELYTSLSNLQSAIKEIESENIKQTDDDHTIAMAINRLYSLGESLSRLRDRSKEADIGDDEKEYLVNEIAEQRKLVDSNRRKLRKFEMAKFIRATHSELQSRLDKIETDDLKPTDDIQTIARAQKGLYSVSHILYEQESRVKRLALFEDERESLRNEIAEQRKLVESKLNVVELCEQWHRISEINIHLDAICGWNLSRDDKKKLGCLKDEFKTIRESILNIPGEERESFEVKNKVAFQKMMSETNSRISKIYLKHTVIKLLYTGIIIAILAVLWKLIKHRKKNHMSGDVNPS